MAGIDKTYINGRDYLLYRNWWIDNYDKMMKERQEYIWLYPFGYCFKNEPDEFTPEFLKDHTEDIGYCVGLWEFPIWNTSESQDKWLVKNCDIPSFRNRIQEVYKHNWIGFKGCKWLKKPKQKLKYVR